MHKRLGMVFGAGGTVLLIVLALWGWQAASDLAKGWGAARPELAILSVKGGCIGALAAAQVMLLTFVVNPIYRRDGVSDAIRLSAALVSALAAVSTIALGLAGR